MKRFTKRTIALVMASVVTVVGAFGANNYKNCLMGLKFDNTPNGEVNMVLQTKSLYKNDMILRKKDLNTYILTLPEFNSEALPPDLNAVSTNITSVNIRTMPYSNNAKGYTRITIKTNNPSLSLHTLSQIYVPSKEVKSIPVDYNTAQNNNQGLQSVKSYNSDSYNKKNYGYVPQVSQNSIKSENEDKEKVYIAKESLNEIESTEPIEEKKTEKGVDKYTKSSSDIDMLYLLMWAFVIVSCSWFFYTKAKNTMAELSGENLQIDVTDEPKKTEKSKNIKKIAKAIRTLDDKYPAIKTNSTTMNFEQVKAQESDYNIVDLDELFNKQKEEQQSVENEENEALEAFLSGFSFDDSLVEIVEEEVIDEEDGYDEEFYENVVNNKDLVFSKEDLICINKLINSEINDETIRNIEQYAVSNPIKKVSKKEILEDLVTTYTISQNIKFNTEDIGILNNLINVELDSDFINDLNVNSVEVDKYEKQIKEYNDKPGKLSEIKTLNVKDMLPDLSEELRKQGNKELEYKGKSDVVYYKEGYDFNILTLKEKLPDLSKVIHQQEAYISKPSAQYEIVDKNYTVGDSIIKDVSGLPDLKEVLANPDKYEEKFDIQAGVDENTLLDSIANVQMKPFYDESRTIEVLNDFNDEGLITKTESELKNLDSAEKALAKIENSEDVLRDESKQTFEKEKLVELNKEEKNNITISKENFIKKDLKGTSLATEKLKRQIVESKNAREVRRANASMLIKQNNIQKNDLLKTAVEPVKKVIEGEAYTILGTVSFDEQKGCYLAKNEKGYVVYAYVGDKVFKLKEYDVLKSEKIQTRLNEKISDETARYLVRIGLQKFIVDVKEDDVKYVMDLC